MGAESRQQRIWKSCEWSSRGVSTSGSYRHFNPPACLSQEFPARTADCCPLSRLTPKISEEQGSLSRSILVSSRLFTKQGFYRSSHRSHVMLPLNPARP